MFNLHVSDRTVGRGNQVDWTVLEKSVLQLAEKREYKEAYKTIIAALAKLYGDKSHLYYPTNIHLTEKTHRKRKRTIDETKVETGENAKPTVVVLASSYIDALFSERRIERELTEFIFGDVVRSVHHELYVHVRDFTSPAYTFENRADYEFLGYYENMQPKECLKEIKNMDIGLG